MTCSKNFDRVLRATCLGLVAMLAVAGCGGSSNNPADAKPASGDGTVIGSDVPPANLAILSVSPASVDLGSVDVGATSGPATVTVTNSGKAASGALTVTVSGTGITATGCTGTLAVGAACTISITAHPAAAGAISGTIAVAEGASAPKTISVSGVATVPGQFSLTPPGPVDLGKVVIKGTATASIVVTNTATTGLTGIVVTVGGTGYALSPTTTTCTDSLAVGQTCTIVVGFTAATGGVATGSVIVSQGGVTKSVALSATVQAPAKLAMTPPTAALTATVGGSSTAVTFYVTNSGDVASGVPTVLLGGPNAADFSIATNSCVTSLAGGATASCSASVVFSPKVLSTANETATLTVSDPGPGASSVVATLSGTAVGPSTLVLSGAPDLGIVVVGASGAPVGFTLRNTGDNNSGGITLATNDPGEFAVVTATDTCTGVDLKKNATCTFSMTFTPSAGAVGVVTARLTASGASTANPAVLGLSGTAVAPAKLVAAPTVLDFGSMPTNLESAPLTLTISNSGGASTGPLTVTNTGAQFKIKGDTCTGASLTAAGTTKSCTIIVTFTSTGTTVDATGAVNVTDGATSASASLHGTGMEHPGLSMSPSIICPQYFQDDQLCMPKSAHAPIPLGATYARFQNKVVGKTTKELTITVTNTTDPTVALDSGTLTFAITGDAAADFKIVQNNCTAPLASTSATTSCVLTLTATPSAVGLRKALLALTTSRAGASQTTLEAKGLAPIEVQPLQVSKTDTGLDFGQVSLGHNDAANDSLPYRVWVRDTTSADLNTTVTVTLPTPTPANFVWPSTGVLFTITTGADDMLTPPVGLSTPPGGTTIGSGGGTNRCNNKTLSLTLGADGLPSTATRTANEALGYTFESASGYWYCDFPVEFYPQSGRGALSADLTATGSGGGTSKLTLTGNATGPLVISPSKPLLAEPVAVGLASTTNMTLTITNEGATAQTGLSFALSGTGAADFQIIGTTCWGAYTPPATHAVSPLPTGALDALQAGDYCWVWLGFQPQTQGSYGVTFTATAANGAGATDDETATVTLQATGSKTFGAITVTPNPGTFADAAFGKTDAAPVTFTVKNNGTLDTGPATLTVSDPNDFEIVTPVGVAGACNISGSWTVPGGGSCTVQVRAKPIMAPTGVGKQLINATLTATANPGGTVIVPLTYYETSNLMVNGASSVAYAFDAAGVGTQASHNFTLSNLGSTAVSLAFTPPAGTAFTVDQLATTTPAACTAGSNTLAAGGSCTLVVKNGNTAAALVGVPTPVTLLVYDSLHTTNNATVLLSSVTLATSSLVTYGIPLNTFAEAGISAGRISLGSVPFSQGQGAPVTVWFQNVGGVATQPLHYRWDSETTASTLPAAPGAVDTANPEFVLTSLYPENPQACLSGLASGGQQVPPLGLCSVTFYFKPSLLNPLDVSMRYRDLVVIDVTTAPEVFVQARAVAQASLFVQEVSSANNVGFFQFTNKTPTAVPLAPEVHTFVVNNGSVTALTLITLPTTVGDFTVTNAATPALTSACGSGAVLPASGTCQLAVSFQPSGTTPVFPWASVNPVTAGSSVLGFMGRTRQPAGLQIMRAPGVPSCTQVSGTSGCVDFTTVAVGGTKTQTLTVVNTGDVVNSGALVTAFTAVGAAATFTEDGGCTGKVLNPYGTAGDRCVVTFTATGVSVALTGTKATFQVGTGTATGAPAASYTLQAEVVKAALLTVAPVGELVTNTFPATAVTGYTQQNFTIYNGANDPTDVTFQTSGVVAVTLGGTGATQFQLVGTTCPPNVGLVSGTGCTVTARFAPTALSSDGNAITATLNVTATPGSAAPSTIIGMPKSALTITPIDDGTAAAPKITMTGQRQLLTVTKDNNAVPTAALDTSISGTDFMLVDDQCYGKVLSGLGSSAGGHCTILVKYIGLTTSTAKTATVTVNGGSAGQSAAIVVSYLGAAATSH